MARTRMVTRTVNENTYTCMCVDTVSAEIINRDFVVGMEFENDDVALRNFQRQYNTDGFKVVAVVAHSVKEILYGMPEADFIRLAKVLPPRSGEKSE